MNRYLIPVPKNIFSNPHRFALRCCSDFHLYCYMHCLPSSVSQALNTVHSAWHGDCIWNANEFMRYLLTSSPLCLLYRNVYVAATKVHCGCRMRHRHCHRLTSHSVCLHVRTSDWNRYRDFCVQVRFVKMRVAHTDVHFIDHWHLAVASASELFVFRRVRKTAKSDLRHGCPSVRMEQIGSHWTDFNEIL